MEQNLENKLGILVRYLQENRAGRHTTDTPGLQHLLDDPEISNWVDQLNREGRLNGRTGMFINGRH